MFTMPNDKVIRALPLSLPPSLSLSPTPCERKRVYRHSSGTVSGCKTRADAPHSAFTAQRQNWGGEGSLGRLAAQMWPSLSSPHRRQR